MLGRKKIEALMTLVAIGIILITGPARAVEINPKTIFFFGLGGLAGAAGHELGHEIMARIEGVELDWDLKRGRWRTYEQNSSKLRRIAVAGFGTQILGSEIVLNSKAIPKKNPFVLGYMVWNILNPIKYTASHEFGWRSHGDLTVLEKNGGNVALTEGVIVAHALWSAWRLYKIFYKDGDDRSPLPAANYLSIAGAQVAPFLLSKKNGGFMLGITWQW
jgi:hypothetical protein